VISAGRVWWGVNRRVWNAFPERTRRLPGVQAYGRWLHRLSSRRVDRHMYVGTFFFRNRPALELMSRLAKEQMEGATLRVAVLGCSIGVEVYSIVWALRRARPELNLRVLGVDTSAEVLRIAAAGVYGPEASELVGSSLFERLTADEADEMFDWDGDQGSVKAWLREGVSWLEGDASVPALVEAIGPQDIVVASNFLCHMDPVTARTCLRNLAGLVSPGGHLFVAGVDLDVRTDVAQELGWSPVPDLRTEIHDGDASLRADWPWRWWGLEPLDHTRPDWETRYAAAFRVGARPVHEPSALSRR